MASGSPTGISWHSVIASVSTVETVTFPNKRATIIFQNRDLVGLAVDEIYFTTDGSTPTVGGSNTWVCSAGQRITVHCMQPPQDVGRQVTVGPVQTPYTAPLIQTTIKLISLTAALYSITAF